MTAHLTPYPSLQFHIDSVEGPDCRPVLCSGPRDPSYKRLLFLWCDGAVQTGAFVHPSHVGKEWAAAFGLQWHYVLVPKTQIL